MAVLATSGTRDTDPPRSPPQRPLIVPGIYDDIRDVALWVLLCASISGDPEMVQYARINVGLLMELEELREKELDESCF